MFHRDTLFARHGPLVPSTPHTVAIVTVVDWRNILMSSRDFQVSEMLEIKNRPMVGNSQDRGNLFEAATPPASARARSPAGRADRSGLKDSSSGSVQMNPRWKPMRPATTATSKTVATSTPAASPRRRQSRHRTQTRIPAAKTAAQPKPAEAPAVTTIAPSCLRWTSRSSPATTTTRFIPAATPRKLKSHSRRRHNLTLAAATNAAERERMTAEARATATYPRWRST